MSPAAAPRAEREIRTIAPAATSTIDSANKPTMISTSSTNHATNRVPNPAGS